VDLLERDAELSTLEGLFAAGGRLLLIGGEAGVGKTALLRRFTSRRERSARVLWGACDALHTPRPLGPLLDIVGCDELAGPSEATAALMAELDAPTPAIVVIEDIHWADEATLDTLRLLTRRIERVPALVVASFRDDAFDPAHPLRVVLGEIASAPAVTRLDLAPLSPAAVAELAARHGVDGPELYRKTAGNPFFVTEVLAAGGAEIPSTVRDAVLARAARLSPGARALLEAASIGTSGVELWLLEWLAGDDACCLDECLASAMLERAGDRIVFRHELARLAVERSIVPDRAAALHRAAVAALAAPPGRAPEPARLADHAEQAGDAEAVLQFAPPAGDRAAALGAHREAAAQYARALRFADGVSTPERASLLERRAYQCYLTNEIEEAIGARRAALACHRALADHRRQGDQLRWLSRLLWVLGREDAAEEEGLAAVRLLERSGPGRELAMAYSNLSQLRMLAWDIDGAVEWGRRAIVLAESFADLEVLAHAYNNVGAAEFLAGMPGGQAKLERSLELSLLHGMEEHAARAYFNLGSIAVQVRSYAVADRHLAAGLEYCSEHDIIAPTIYLSAWRARSELDQGRWASAAEEAERVISHPRVGPSARIPALIVLGLVRARRGESGAAEPLAEAHRAAGADELPRVAAALAEVGWLSRDGDAARAPLAAADGAGLRRGNPWAAGELALWRRRLGLDEAAGDEPVPADSPLALQLAGDWEGAAHAWERLGCPYEAALALADGDEAAMRSGLARLQELGARPAAALVGRRLRDRGARDIPRGPRPATRGNPANLTARELEVLALMAEGLPNAGIAERLVVSPKTIGHHVSAVLRKLGARTRTEATTKAMSLGLVAHPPR
jgi:DNA-binding CsgD family transcriptional regulator/tetratricopeptide (TPR) repeat protein